MATKIETGGGYQAGYDDGYSAGHNGTAGTGDVLEGKTFSNNAGTGLTGKMPNRGIYYESATNVGATSEYFHATFPQGYYHSDGNAWAPEIRVKLSTMHDASWYDLHNSVTRLTSVQNYDGTWTSSSYTAQEEGMYMVVSASGAAQAVGNAFANATTTGKVLVSIASGQTNPSAEGWPHMSWQVIIAYLKVGQSIGGNARGSSSYGRSRVETYRIG